MTASQHRRPAGVPTPGGEPPQVPKTDTELLRLLLESLRRWQPAKRERPAMSDRPPRPRTSSPRTALAALRSIRREHPVLVHGLYTYLSVTGVLLALTAAIAVRG